MDTRTSAPDTDTVLVVDLDSTLSRTDTFHEALLAIAGTRPQALIGVAASLSQGKVATKSRVAKAHVVPPEDLVLNDVVLDLLREARAEGRRTALVTASHFHQAQAIAEATGLFDEVFGTCSPETEGTNLSGSRKAAFLEDRYGPNGFDYVGDARTDVPVWRAARRAYTVGASEPVRQAAEAAGDDVIHLDPPATGPARWRSYLRAMRPHQWSKNLLIFLPYLAAHGSGSLISAVVAFFAFSLMASSVYVLNDLIDLSSDRSHPRKRKRPFASGAVPLSQGVVLGGTCLLASVLLSLVFLPPLFMAVLFGYFVATLAYSLALKRRLMIDIVTLAGLYTLRIIAGGVASGVILSPWMLAFSMFLFLSLAAVKRQAELVDQISRGQDKAHGRAYEVQDMQIVVGTAIASAHSAVMVFALYLSSDDVQALYATPALLWLVCPLLLFWLLRMVMVTHRGRMEDDPIVFAASDRISWAAIGLSGAVVVAASL